MTADGAHLEGTADYAYDGNWNAAPEGDDNIANLSKTTDTK